MTLRFLALALLLMPISAAQCDAEASLNVPAVVGNGGGLVNATMKLVPGTGKVFVSTTPRTASDTQQSIEEAVAFAKMAAAMEDLECDVLLSFDSEDVRGHIEGPSAGAAMSVMLYSLLSNASMRQDTILTGSIDSGGHVGAVGGLHEKAKAAAMGGAAYFLTPPVTFYEMLVLRNMEEEYGITVLEVYNGSDIIGFMLFNRTINQTGFRAGEEELPDIMEYDTGGMEEFESVADDMLRILQAELDGIRPDGNESGEAKRFFENNMETSEFILGKGYYFTAANAAFLDYIDVSTIKAILEDDLDLRKRRDLSYSCLDSISRPRMTDSNFEWIIGSELREAWALDKLNSTDISEPLITEERYAIYHELMYADAWCQVSKSLAGAAGEEGTAVDQRAWRELAEGMLEEAEGTQHSADTAERLEIARKSFDRGRYGAAIYDCVFVIEMDLAEEDLASITEEELADSVNSLADAEPASLWGSVYRGQGAYLAQQGAGATAYKILRLAQGLDTATALMLVQLELNGEEADDGHEWVVPALQLSIFITFILLLTYVTLKKRGKGRLDGDKDKRHRGAAGAEQKKGRA